jgi:acetyl esterase/lipase
VPDAPAQAAGTLSEQARAYLAQVRRPEPLPAPDDIEGWRRAIARVNRAAEADALPHLAGYPVDRSVRGRVFVARPREPLKAAERCAVLFFHGGGLVFFAGPMVEYRTAVEAMRLHVTVAGVDFRQPPDHPFPAAVDDGLEAYGRMLDAYGAANLCLHGFSGGANIALSTLYRARDAGLPMPAGLVLVGPMLDLTEAGDSHRRFDDGGAFSASIASPARLYAGAAPLDDPRLSPLFGDPTDLPPVYLQAGERDVMLSDAAAFHRMLLQAGVKAHLDVMPLAPHGGFGGATPEDAAARTRVLQFMLDCWGC